MRKLQREQRSKKPVKKTEPLAEGIRKKRPHGFFTKMSDEKIIAFTHRVMEERGTSGRNDFRKADAGLYKALKKRGLLGRIRFEKKLRDWAPMSDEEIVEYAIKFVKTKKIKNKNGLRREDHGLYYSLWSRKLLDDLRFEKKQIKWSSMSHEDLLDYARRFIEENRIKNKKEFERKNSKLHGALKRRGLLDRLEFEKKRRRSDFFSKMSDDELLRYAKKVTKEKAIEDTGVFQREDYGLYQILLKRGLFEKAGFKRMKSNQRRWASMGDDEVVDYARGFVAEERIKNRSGLAKTDYGLYQVLKKRGLLGKLKFKSDRRTERKWFSMSDEELTRHAKRFIAERKIENKKGLVEEDIGLHNVLRRRRLIDSVFAPLESRIKREAVQQVVDAMKEFDDQ